MFVYELLFLLLDSSVATHNAIQAFVKDRVKSKHVKNTKEVTYRHVVHTISL